MLLSVDKSLLKAQLCVKSLKLKGLDYNINYMLVSKFYCYCSVLEKTSKIGGVTPVIVVNRFTGWAYKSYGAKMEFLGRSTPRRYIYLRWLSRLFYFIDIFDFVLTKQLYEYITTEGLIEVKSDQT